MILAKSTPAIAAQLAAEVLTLVRNQRLKPKPGAVMQTEQSFPDKGQPLRPFLTNQKQCFVCATGALLFAYVVNHVRMKSPGQHPFNGYCPNWETVDLADSMYQELAKFFSPLQLKLIEHSFEGIHHERQINPKMLAACKEFYHTYPSPMLRLKAIMENIIANKGTFKP